VHCLANVARLFPNLSDYVLSLDEIEHNADIPHMPTITNIRFKISKAHWNTTFAPSCAVSNAKRQYITELSLSSIPHWISRSFITCAKCEEVEV